MQQVEKERRKEDFESWITFLPDKINELKKVLPKDISDKLDLSDSSLVVLEGYLLSTFSYDDITKPENKNLVDCLAAYVGSAFKKCWKQSYWDIELDDEKQLYFGVPVLKFKDQPLPPISPYHTITTAMDRKKGDIMQLILSRTQDRLQKA
ncbi:hypothetical protein QWY31_00130 [Cytophagales bacterium LB-30]|uniref:Uncharacterized protein n=1 Tax=Shiella aurantiaca TaxID=3058365 RepID=A0ABT8F1H6_9BACT|nr:hypothetical protein [Shiella aurantiaca]MDN4163881.1 hypothetical protein [Shiella aurantiaca]